LTKKTKLLEIGVHIADSTAYVEKDSLFDKEALFRGTTLYLVKKIYKSPIIFISFVIFNRILKLVIII